MFDTVNLRIHKLRHKHSALYEQLISEAKGRINFESDSPFSILKRDIWINSDGTNVTEKFASYSKKTASSHYTIQILVDKTRDKMDINFSIPKYFYGNNVIQAVPHPFENTKFTFTKGVVDTVPYQYSILQQQFLRYIRAFFANEFFMQPIDYTCVEVTRIDLCFNQIFNTKNDAKEWLEAQKQVRRRNQKPGSKESIAYKESIFFNTQDYSFKVYHKGPEFTKNDAKHFVSKAEQSKRDFLQNLADRTLRYEMTFRKGMMAYIYGYKVAKQKDKDFLLAQNLYNRIKNLQNSGKWFWDINETRQIIQDTQKFYIKGKTVYEYFEPRTKLPNDNKSLHNDFKILNTFYDTLNNKFMGTKYFWCKLGEWDFAEFTRDKNELNDFIEIKHIEMHQELFSQMGKHFLDYIKGYQVKSKVSFNDFKEKLDKYNKTESNKRNILRIGKKDLYKTRTLDPQKMKMVFLATQNMTLRELTEKTGMSRQTEWRYRKDLEKLGVTEKDNLTKPMVNPGISYQNYYQEILFNSKSVFSSQSKKLYLEIMSKSQ